MSIRVIVNFNVKSSKLTEFVDILNSVKTDLPKIKGCQGVNIFRNSSNSNMFTLVEKWETKDFHQVHLDKLSEDGTWELISQHLSEDPESGYYNHL
jgi:quinol monooxygenase YgiN